MAIVTRIDSLEAALTRAPYLDKAVSATLAGIDHAPIDEGSTACFLERSFEEAETGLWVASEGEELLGVCMTGALVEPLSGERLAVVLALFVEPEHRHQGVARGLIRVARAALTERGVKRLGARVEHNDDARISMGERWGWTRGWEWMDSGESA